MYDDKRRKFLGICLGILACTGAGAFLYPVLRYIAPQKTRASLGKVEIPESGILPGEAKFFDFGGTTAVVVHTKDKGLIALSAVCTHLGCIVQWQKDKQEFLCPCHGGRYTESGIVIAGPPPRPLPRLPLTVANGIITVG